MNVKYHLSQETINQFTVVIASKIINQKEVIEVVEDLGFGRSAGGYGRNDRSGGRFGRDRPPREMHKATCGDCGNECEIPFEPRNDKPVYCNDCFQNHKPERSERRGGSRFGR